FGAKVGDDVYGEDPTVNKLEARAAELFGREASLFVPTGSMGNAICLDVLTRPGNEVICDRLSHVYNYELSSMAVFSGLIPRAVDGPEGAPTAEQVEAAIHPDIYYVAPTGCISLENTANIAGGRIYPLERMRSVITLARSRGIPVHLDGARIFNSAMALGLEVSELTAGTDCVMFCLSKGLGAPVGSMVVGSKEFIGEARRVRKRMGGGMRQAGVLAAAGLYALEHNIERLALDHVNARRLAQALAELDGIATNPDTVETNIVMVHTAAPAPEADELCRRLGEMGVRVDPMGQNKTRLVTHLDVSSDEISRAIESFRRAAA
ncbi:MAG TPA: GntG family PLP-dependent aldolase, partial [Candidatus Glassbacteria bacterium]|nr:GntG family PLP-dependent aldolase [Candidatus Glassbacteria bacterium]